MQVRFAVFPSIGLGLVYLLCIHRRTELHVAFLGGAPHVPRHARWFSMDPAAIDGDWVRLSGVKAS